MKVTLFVASLFVATWAEPPVPSSQYLPGNAGPSPNYGTPSYNGNGKGPNPQYGPPSTGYGAPNGGGNGGYGGGDDEGAPASYQFEYMVKDDESGNDFGHMESREGDVAQGKYYVLLPDGRKQIVEYTADSDGYHPKVTYEGGNGNGGGYPRGGNGGGYPGRNGGGGGYPGGNGGNGGYNY